MIIVCAYCGCEADKPTGSVNRSRKIGAPFYCSRECSGKGRRSNKTSAQKKSEKAAYDREYRAKNADAIKSKKRAYHKRTYDPKKEAAKRKEKMPRHLEYCRSPEYRAWKKEYDRKYRAKKNYGEYAECFLLTQDIRDECLNRQTDYEIRMQKGTLNKVQKRRIENERSKRSKSEKCPLGNLEGSQRRQDGPITS